MSLTTGEQIIIENEFGTVTNKRLIYFAEKGWFQGGYREDIPLKQVVSIRYATKRGLILGCILIGLGATLMGANAGVIVLFLGLLFILCGAIHVWGSPIVNIVTAGGTQAPEVGFPWRRNAAQQFVTAVRNQLFQE